MQSGDPRSEAAFCVTSEARPWIIIGCFVATSPFNVVDGYSSTAATVSEMKCGRPYDTS